MKKYEPFRWISATLSVRLPGMFGESSVRTEGYGMQHIVKLIERIPYQKTLCGLEYSDIIKAAGLQDELQSGTKVLQHSVSTRPICGKCMTLYKDDPLSEYGKWVKGKALS